MSETASATVVEIVGALTPKETSSLTGMGVGSKMPISRGRSIRRGHAEREVGDDIAIMGVVAGMWGSRLRSSGVLPL
jgi:microcompartment protein CcmK/EutM